MNPAKKAYYRSLPAKRMGAGVLFFNDAEQVLLVEPAYKDSWDELKSFRFVDPSTAPRLLSAPVADRVARCIEVLHSWKVAYFEGRY